ncbi:hypothetical protein [Candidatus Palauibacter sp.]|uniref:hypothetical protein n=1 Tax=Candidatus Palauibacter sp. TaxID=3101350 RepID=UPI003B5CEECD
MTATPVISEARWSPLYFLGQSERQGELSPELVAALRDLAELGAQGHVTSETVSMARDTLHDMYRFAPYRYDVYSEDGQVILDATEDEISIVVLFEPAGSARCFVSMDGDQRRAWYGNGAMVFGWFMQEALLKLLTLTRRQIRTWTMCWISMKPLHEGYSAAVGSVLPRAAFGTEPSLKLERYFQSTGVHMLPSKT